MTDLVVTGLSVAIDDGAGPLGVVDNVHLTVRGGRATALVGESGSGKTLTALSIVRLLSDGVRITGGSATLKGPAGDVDILRLGDAELRGVRGRRVAMIFQEPMTALNPLIRVIDQVGEGLEIHQHCSRRQARARALTLLERVGVPTSRAHAHPHELSGGQRQRVMIAAALAAEPEIIIADEPTTALDVTVQSQVLQLLRELVAERQMGLLLITHDLGVVAEVCDDIAVIYAGRVVESGTVDDVFAKPLHPYTRGLLGSMPSVAPRGQPLPAIPGVVPPIRRWPTGCRFRDRCTEATDACGVDPPVVTVGTRTVACVHVEASR